MRLRPITLALSVLIATSACQQKAPSAPEPAATPAAQPSTAQADAQFADLSKRWLDGWLEQQPVSATQTGNHAFDDRVEDLSAAGRQKFVDFSKKMLAELDGLDVAKLSRDNQVDAAILRNQIRYDIWAMETLQSWAW